MALADGFKRVLSEYNAAKSELFTSHDLAKFLRADLPAEIEAILGRLDFQNYDVRGSAGQGQWTESPWVAILDPLVTDSPQRAYYPVYLFREDLTGFHLSLNQGMTEAKENYRSNAKEALKGRAFDFRNRLGKLPAQFSAQPIDLRPSSGSNNSAYYEAGNICAKFYDAEAVPLDDILIADLAEVMRLYSLLSESENSATGTTATEDDEQENPLVQENYAAFRLHKRIERNAKLSKLVKQVHGYICEACGFDFTLFYPFIERNKYIEAHHLVPIATLKGKKIARDPKSDFAVLCANCHRMIHRTAEPGDLKAFVGKLFKGPH